MELEQQLQTLTKDAAELGIAPIVIEKAVAPVLKLLAQQLNHLEYFVLQNFSQDWVLITIKNNQETSQEKRVIYAFTTVKDAATFQGSDDPDILAVPIPVTHLLFELFSVQQIDSIIFFDTPGNLTQAVEIQRDRLDGLIFQQIQQLQQIPPDLA
ncbi:hypothetical protein Sta7437_1092 [Stanieria cyanosphaera PCC 7437]|uniref:Uncharacterized protein n=1 Tax=Stanieria cyanosphaera (strain ATCC 29371 / PCC 7437) TaxID=111780 RepID=K9XQ76_STAC7|nr:hypothetical protein [Stanieria cyanosphaera]AFZ34668.1 hypothetical protein Sta7437_1092 [Stanieria cyanosphaera PCC 7437]